MNHLKQFWDKVPKLPRKWKIVCNLLFTCFLLVFILSILDWPMPTAEMEYRKLEKKLLLSPSEIVYSHKSGSNQVFVTEGTGWITAGNTFKTQSNDIRLEGYEPVIHFLLPKGEFHLIPLSRPTEDNEFVVALYGLPEQAVLAEMELDLFDIPPRWNDPLRDSEDETFYARADKADNGWLFLTFTPHDHEDTDIDCAMDALWWEHLAPFYGIDVYDYRLTLYDAHGACVESISGTLPEDDLIMW